MKTSLSRLLLPLFAAGATQAATFTVTNSNDSGAGSLRQAILDANVTAAADTINFNTAGHFSVARTITLTSGELVIDRSLIIDAPSGANRVTISGDDASRILSLVFPSSDANPALTLRHLTFEHGRAVVPVSSLSHGGGIVVYHPNATLTMEDCTVRQCETIVGSGGGLYASADTVTIRNSIFSHNTSESGGGGLTIQQTQTATLIGCVVQQNVCASGSIGLHDILSGLVENCSVKDNTSATFAAGINATDSTLLINSCAITGNQAEYGAALDVRGSAIVDLINSTIANNENPSIAGGINVISGGSLRAINCTITGNTGHPGGIESFSATLAELTNCIVAGNIAEAESVGPDVNGRGGPVTSGGHNIIGIVYDERDFAPRSSDLIGTPSVPVSPRLGPLQDNGGGMLTRTPQPNSPAIDAGGTGKITDPPFDGPNFLDQRGMARIVGSEVDIGAVEVQSLEVTNTNDSGAGSLRDTLVLANSQGGGTVGFRRNVFGGVKQTITLTSGQIPISTSITLRAPEVGLKISGNNASRIFNVTGGSSFLKRLELENGSSTADGGAVRVTGATTSLEMELCRVANNAALRGGGLYVEQGKITAMDCAIVQNNASTNGGGVVLDSGGTFTAANTTIANNQTDGHGGGIFVLDGVARLINVTIAGNGADQNNDGTGDGGGIRRAGAASISVTLGNTLVANNTDGAAGAVHPDISTAGAGFTSLGHNLIGKSDGGSGFTHNVNGDKVGTIAGPLNPLLGVMLLPGYLTPNPGSPALDSGDNALLNDAAWLQPPSLDQRGQYRIVNNTVEIGAAEGPQSSIVTMTIADSAGSEHFAEPAKLRLRRSLPTAAMAVSLTVAGSGTASLSDYTLSGPSYIAALPNFLVTFPVDDDTITVTVTPTQDPNVEGIETVAITLLDGGTYDPDPAGVNTRSVNILDDEFTVSSASNAGAGSLREAIGKAEDAGGGKITIPLPLLITLNGSPLQINADTEIIGNISTINAAGRSRAFEILGDGGGTVKLQGLIITNGIAPVDEDGGGIYAENAGLEIRGCAITHCEGDSGGGIYSYFTCPQLHIINSSISDNSARLFGGGGVRTFTDDNSFTNVTVARNSARGDGGGMYVSGIASSQVFTNCTITENIADSDNSNVGNGGGIYWPSGTLTLNNTVISGNFDTPGNSGGGDIHPNLSTLSGLLTSGGGNFVGNKQGAASLLPTGAPNGSGDYVGTNAAPLDALLTARNDLRLFYSFPDTSQLKNHGVNGTVTEPLDQRGRTRIGNGTVDIGAVEMTHFMVTNNLNSGAGSLRQTIIAANAAGGGDIVFSPTVFATLQTISVGGEMDITSSIDLMGPAVGLNLVSTGTNRILKLAPAAAASITLRNLFLRDGDTTSNSASDQQGGNLIVAANANAVLRQCTFTGGFSPTDGGNVHLAAGATLICYDSEFISGTANRGGNLSSNAPLVMERCAIAAGAATTNGGGLSLFAPASLTNCSFYGNDTNGSGGGISFIGLPAETLSLLNCTLAFNRADADLNSVGTGSGLRVQSGIVTLKNSLFFYNITGSQSNDISGMITTLGHNSVFSTTGATGFTAGQNGDLLANGETTGGFTSHGGPTNSISIFCDSLTCDAGDDTGAPPTDQRGLPRRFGASVDIGAYELQHESYDYWAAYSFGNGPGSRDDGGDFDGDGFANGLEYIFETNPSVRDRPPAMIPARNGTNFTITVPISPLALPSNYRVRMSADMTSWNLTPTQGALTGTSQHRYLIPFTRSMSTTKGFGRAEYVPMP